MLVLSHFMSRQINRFERKIPTMRFPSEPRGFTWLCKHLLEKASKLRNVTKAHHDCLMIQKLMSFFSRKKWVLIMNAHEPHECSWWTLMSVHESIMSTHERSWVFMSVHERSWVFMSAHERSSSWKLASSICDLWHYLLEFGDSIKCGHFDIKHEFFDIET